MLSASLPRCCGLAQSRNYVVIGWVLTVVDRTVGCEAEVGMVQRRNTEGDGSGVAVIGAILLEELSAR